LKRSLASLTHDDAKNKPENGENYNSVRLTPNQIEICKIFSSRTHQTWCNLWSSMISHGLSKF